MGGIGWLIGLTALVLASAYVAWRAGRADHASERKIWRRALRSQLLIMITTATMAGLGLVTTASASISVVIATVLVAFLTWLDARRMAVP